MLAQSLGQVLEQVLERRWVGRLGVEPCRVGKVMVATWNKSRHGIFGVYPHQPSLRQ